jgi:hypothetical protein
MANGPFDWQTAVAGLIGVMALAHVARRWLGPRVGVDAGVDAGRDVGAAGAQPPGSLACTPTDTPATRCGTGCGACGPAPTSPPKDHRITIVRA